MFHATNSVSRKLAVSAKILVFVGLYFFGCLTAVSAQSTFHKEIQAVISKQIGAFRSGDDQQAFALATPKVRRIFRDQDRFIKMVKTGYPMIHDPLSFDFEALEPYGGRLIQSVVFVGRDQQSVRASYVMHKQKDGRWLIDGVSLEALSDQGA